MGLASSMVACRPQQEQDDTPNNTIPSQAQDELLKAMVSRWTALTPGYRRELWRSHAGAWPRDSWASSRWHLGVLAMGRLQTSDCWKVPLALIRARPAAPRFCELLPSQGSRSYRSERMCFRHLELRSKPKKTLVPAATGARARARLGHPEGQTSGLIRSRYARMLQFWRCLTEKRSPAPKAAASSALLLVARWQL